MMDDRNAEGRAAWHALEFDGPPDEPERKPCPLCAEWIAADARKCRYCGELIAAAPEETPGLFGWFKRLFRRGYRIRYEFIPVDDIRSNPYQPREYMDAHSAEFERLKQSIKNFGVIVPIIVRREKRGFQLVAGQRRLAASRALKIRSIPALIEVLGQKEMMEVAYLENLHRKELNRVESGRALQRIIFTDRMDTWRSLGRRFGLDVDEVRVQKGLLDLPVLLQEAVARGMISVDQSRALAAIREEMNLKSLLKEAYQKKLSPEEILAWAKQAGLAVPNPGEGNDGRKP